MQNKFTTSTKRGRHIRHKHHHTTSASKLVHMSRVHAAVGTRTRERLTQRDVFRYVLNITEPRTRAGAPRAAQHSNTQADVLAQQQHTTGGAPRASNEGPHPAALSGISHVLADRH